MADFNHIERWLLPKLAARGLSIERFAREVGVTRTSVYYYLSDHNRPTTQTMARMCKFLSVPLEDGLKQYTPRSRQSLSGYGRS